MVRLRSSLWVTPATILCRLTTLALYQRSFRWFEACSCKPAPRGPPSSFVQLRTLYEKVRSWRTILRKRNKFWFVKTCNILPISQIHLKCMYIERLPTIKIFENIAYIKWISLLKICFDFPIPPDLKWFSTCRIKSDFSSDFSLLWIIHILSSSV